MDFKEIILSYHPCDQRVIEEVDRCCKVEKWDKGEYLSPPGSMPKKIFFIKNGLLRFGFTQGDDEDTLFFGTSGDIWLEPSAWFEDSFGPVFEPECLVATEAYVLGFDDCRRIMKDFPGWTEWMFKTAMGQLLMLQKKYKLFNSKSAVDRYETFVAKRKLLNQVPLKYVAQYIGVTASSLSRIRAGYLKRSR